MATIQSIQSYKTSDGEFFIDRELAMKHEQVLEEKRELEEHRAEIERTVECYITDQANKGTKGFDSDRSRKQKANVARSVVEWLATWDRSQVEPVKSEEEKLDKGQLNIPEINADVISEAAQDDMEDELPF